MEEVAGASRSIFGVDPLDDFAVFLGDWIWQNGEGVPDLEALMQQIEAKLGVLIDRQTEQRVQLPVLTETIVDLRGVRFESNMSMVQHRQFNKLLNQLVTHSASQPPNARVRYAHQKEVDSFYDEMLEGVGHPVHLRVTRDANTQQIKPNSVVNKRRIADLNVYSPRRPFDYRISINAETPMPPPPETSSPVYVREKDRLSYTHENFNVDLTQVILPNKEPIHELEVEFRDASQLMHLAHLAKSSGPQTNQEWTKFDDQVLVFLNNIRLLMRCVYTNYSRVLTAATLRQLRLCKGYSDSICSAVPKRSVRHCYGHSALRRAPLHRAVVETVAVIDQRPARVPDT